MSLKNIKLDPRTKSLVKNALGGGVARASSVLTGYISIPLVLNHLGVDAYGVWVTILSIATLLSFADLGIGNGLMNAVALANGSGDSSSLIEAISSAYAMLIATALGIGLLAYGITTFIPIEQLLRIPISVGPEETRRALLAVLLCFSLSIPINIVQRVQLGLQRGFQSSFWQVLSSVLTVAGLATGVACQLGLDQLALVYVGIPLVLTAANALTFFGFQRRDIVPTRTHATSRGMRRLMASASQFLTVQIIAAVTFNADVLLISLLSDSKSVSEYFITERAFALVSVLIAVLVTPLWPAYTEAIARRDLDWVRATVARSL